MDICNEDSRMWNVSIRDVVHSLVCRLGASFGKSGPRRNDDTVAQRELAGLSPWLKRDLGVGHDGKPLDRTP